MITYVIAVILAVLIVITIMHDISIYRLWRKFYILQAFIDVTMRQLERVADHKTENSSEKPYNYDAEPQAECEITDCDYHDACKKRGQTDCQWK